MRDATIYSTTTTTSSSTTATRFLCVILLIYCMEIGLVAALSDEIPLQSNNDNPQVDDEISKRDWNKDLHIWGKRGWNNLHGGWGLKRSIPAAPATTWNEQTTPEKRAWQNLQSGWGKRFLPNDDEYAASRQLSALLDLDNMNQLYSSEYGPDFDLYNDDEKRNWGQFHGGWGKRSKWEKFRGSWGKREPAWSNLKGIWGKRSIPDQIAQ